MQNLCMAAAGLDRPEEAQSYAAHVAQRAFNLQC
jgi:hypothetical protein